MTALITTHDNTNIEHLDVTLALVFPGTTFQLTHDAPIDGYVRLAWVGGPSSPTVQSALDADASTGIWFDRRPSLLELAYEVAAAWNEVGPDSVLAPGLNRIHAIADVAVVRGMPAWVAGATTSDDLSPSARRLATLVVTHTAGVAGGFDERSLKSGTFAARHALAVTLLREGNALLATSGHRF